MEIRRNSAFFQFAWDLFVTSWPLRVEKLPKSLTNVFLTHPDKNKSLKTVFASKFYTFGQFIPLLWGKKLVFHGLIWPRNFFWNFFIFFLFSSSRSFLAFSGSYNAENVFTSVLAGLQDRFLTFWGRIVKTCFDRFWQSWNSEVRKKNAISFQTPVKLVAASLTMSF